MKDNPFELDLSWARHCPRCGADGLAVSALRRLDCAACGFRYYQNIATGVSAVLRVGDAVAWIVRGHEPGKGLLDWPGGFVDPGENLEEALAREASEELGISLPRGRYLLSRPNVYPYAGVTYLTLDVFFEFSFEVPPVAALNEEVLALRWLRAAEVAPADIAFGSVRSAWEVLALGINGNEIR